MVVEGLCATLYLVNIFAIKCPTLIRSDCRTENTAIATCQMMFRDQHRDRYAGYLTALCLEKYYECIVCVSMDIIEQI